MTTPGDACNLVEIFWSVQGEGVRVGEPCVFVRFGECDLRCAWCDSPQTWLRAPRCRIERAPGSGTFEERVNPVSVADVVTAVARLQLPGGGLVSLTGGEPLLQPEAVRRIAAALRALPGTRYPVLLETHGLESGALADVVEGVDVVSMDWKLASDVRRASDPRHGAVAEFHDAHAAFLACAVASGRASVYVKIVVTPDTRDEELDAACARIAAIAPATPLILQPVTPVGRVRETPSAARLLAWLRRCRAQLPDVRVIPQTHKSLGVM
jgi:organic radical activating enzyme